MTLPHPQPRWGRRSALFGGLIWLSLLPVQLGDSAETGFIQRLVLLGILVVVPLALSLAPAPGTNDKDSWLFRLALLTQPIGAIATIPSFLIKPGPLAAAFVSLWFWVTGVIAFWGLSRLLRAELRNPPELSISAGLLFLPVGSSWLIVSRLGIQLAGFGDTIILLTAIHFHFAAYAAPILAGLAGRKLNESGAARTTFVLIPIGIIAGTPLVAVGISFSPLIALVGTLLIATAVFLLAILITFFIIPRIDSLTARILLSVSAISSACAMLLACVYAYSIVVKTLLIDIPQMAQSHGLLNGIGFVLCGLIAWSVVQRPSPSNASNE